MYKKRKMILLTVIITLLVLPVTSVEAAKCPTPSTISVQKVKGKITRFEETITLNIPEFGLPPGAYYRTSVYAVKVKGGVVLIDCGDDTLAEDLYQAVSNKFKKPIKAVYVTHYHADHAGGGSYFQSLGIPVYAPLAEAGPIQLGANVGPGLPDEFTYQGYTPDGYYEHIELLDGFEVIPAPGHTPGAVHIEYEKGNNEYLFTADTILPMAEDDESLLDFTFELSFQTAVQNYELEDAGYGTFWSDQQDTLYELLDEADEYKRVLTGHTPTLRRKKITAYIMHTIGILEMIPSIPPMP